MNNPSDSTVLLPETDLTKNPRAPLLRAAQRPSVADTAAETEPFSRQPEMRADSVLPASESEPTPVISTTTASKIELEPRVAVNDDEPSTDRLLSWFERGRFFRWALYSSVLLVVLLLSVETIGMIKNMLSYNLPASLLLSGLLLMMLGFIGLGCYREYRQLVSLRELGDLRERGERLLASDGYGQGGAYFNAIKALYRGQSDALRPALAEFERQQQTHHSDADQVRLLSHTVGAHLDQQAQRLIAQQVRQLALLSALNPLALLDSLVALWLTLRMIRGVATIYGNRPGLLASLRLAREVVLLVTATGATDLIADSAVDMTSAGVAGLLSARLGQGVVSGLLLARLGLYTITLCRPLPQEESQAALWQVLRKQVFSLFQQDPPVPSQN